MASRKSRSSAPSAPRADSAAGFRAALARAISPAPGTLLHALQDSMASKEQQRSFQALADLAQATLAISNDGYRPHRIPFPSASLPPLP